MKKRDIKTNLFDHSEAKVRLLGAYLRKYLSIICNDGYTKRIKIYDLFCGEGLYENGGEGSPLVIMRQVKDVHFSNIGGSSKPKIDVRFNDLNIEKAEKVKRVIIEKSLYYPEFGTIEYSSNDYETECKNLPVILSNFKQLNQKAFIFIDPYEYRHIRVNQIKQLMQSGNSEVLLWLPTQFMYRFEKAGTPEALQDFINELDIFKEWKPSNHVWDFVNQLKEGFQTYMGDKYFVEKFTIQKDSSTVFCLFFFSSHIKGFEKMLESKWEIDTENGFGWEYNYSQISLFQNQKVNGLEKKLLEVLKSPRSNGELYELILRMGFLPKHANEVLTSFQERNLISIILQDGNPARKKSFYLGYRYFKEDPKKVTFKLS